MVYSLIFGGSGDFRGSGDCGRITQSWETLSQVLDRGPSLQPLDENEPEAFLTEGFKDGSPGIALPPRSLRLGNQLVPSRSEPSWLEAEDTACVGFNTVRAWPCSGSIALDSFPC